jgi:hypothetical protein
MEADMNILTRFNKTDSETTETVVVMEEDTTSVIDAFSTLLVFVLAWTMLIASTHFMGQNLEAKTIRMVSYQGQIYYVTGRVENSIYKAIPLDGGKETLIPVKDARKVKVAGFATEKTNQKV